MGEYKTVKINNCMSVEKFEDGSIHIIGRYENSPECEDDIWLVKGDAEKLKEVINKEYALVSGEENGKK